MPLPVAPLPMVVEILIEGAWVDISGDVYTREPVTITRGRRDERSTVDHGRCSLVLNNRSGKYTPRNPTSPYFGKLGRNTQLRVRVPVPELLGSPVLDTFTRTVSNGWGTADSGHTWTVSGGAAADFSVSSGQGRHSHGTVNVLRRLVLNTERSDLDCVLDVTTPAAITGAALVTGVVARFADSNNFYWLRTELNPDTGAGRTVTAKITKWVGGVETGLKTAVVPGLLYTAGIPLRSRVQVQGAGLRVKVWPTAAAEPAAWAASTSDTTFTFGQVGVQSWLVSGNTNTLPLVVSFDNLAVASNLDVRFHGEVAEWPQRWDISGVDVWVPLEADGIMRRLAQGAKAVASPMRREVTANPATVAAYWPLEDGAGTRQAVSAIGGPPMLATGTVEFAAAEVMPGSAPLPRMGGGSALSGTVPATVDTTGAIFHRMVLSIPDSGLTTGSILDIFTSGSAQKWSLLYSATGDLQLRASAAGPSGYTTVDETAVINFNLDGKTMLLRVGMQQNGANVDVQIFAAVLGVDGRITTDSGSTDTLIGITLGRATSVTLGPGGALSGAVVGHLAILDSIVLAYQGPMTGWADERTTDRLDRLGRDNAIAVAIDTPGLTAPLGAQATGTLLQVAQAAADADQGILYETRHMLGLAYRSASSQSGQTPSTIAYGQLVAAEPVEDDQAIRNDVTASGTGGGTARAVLTAGPLSTQDPPAGVGVYDRGEVEANVGGGGQLPDVAHWLLNLGTWDEARYPQVTLNLAALGAPPVAAVAGLDVGDQVTVTGLPAWLPPDDVELLVQGYTEIIEPFGWRFSWTCSPAGPYRVGVYGTHRYDTSGAAVASVAASTGALTVATSNPDAPLWTVTDGSYDLMVGGERVTVTAVASAVSDTFTRSVSNGWGTATSGQAWTTIGGSASNYSVDGARGVILLPTGDTASRSLVLPDSYSTVDVKVTMRASAVATGANLNGYIRGRHQDSNNYYRLWVAFDTGGNVDLAIQVVVAATGTTLVSAANVVTYSAGSDVHARFQAFGSTLRGKVWTGGLEPDAWTLTTTDTTYTSGKAGVRAVQSTNNTNTNPTISFDNFEITNPQSLTVTRSVNGVVKTHPAGTPVRLFRPVAAGLWSGPAAATGVAVKAADQPRSAGVNEPAVSTGTDTVTIATNQPMAGTAALTEFPVTKNHQHTVLRVLMSVSRFDVTSALTDAAYGVRIGTTDYDVIGHHFLNATSDHQFAVAVRNIPGIAAGTYTVQAFWRRVSGGGTPTRDINDWLSIDVTEVHAA